MGKTLGRYAAVVLAVLIVVRIVAGCFNPSLNINDVTTGATPEYPDIQPQRFAAPPTTVFHAAAAVARTMGWETTKQDMASGVIEAVATTPLMRFKDDVSITVTGMGDGSVVNVRSRSRLGKGDMGANAKRIRAFQQELATRVPAAG